MQQIVSLRPLHKLDPSKPHAFEIPTKRIDDGEKDLPFFLTSIAYFDMMNFLLQMNVSMFPQLNPETRDAVTRLPLDEDSNSSGTIAHLQALLRKLGDVIDETPPDPGPRRFGNVSFRKWYEKVTQEAPGLLKEALPETLQHFPTEGPTSVLDELIPYFLDSFGSAQRLDYGTGHELSFLAFVACIWKLGGFDETPEENAAPRVQERRIVLEIVQPYLQLIRRLILTYNLEPAGSHGVWGLDDHSFIPYIFGSAQLSPAVEISNSEVKLESIPTEGSLLGAPSPSDITKPDAVKQERQDNMYFSAIGFIYDVKKGPFWEHSPVLYDISGVPGGWAKINKGMIKMYNAEVLSKFPVVQHFPFGSLFRWEKDPDAKPPPASVHTKAYAPRQARMQQDISTAHPAPTRTGQTFSRPPPGSTLGQPAARYPMTAASHVQQGPLHPPRGTVSGTQAPWASTGKATAPLPPTRAPWAAHASASSGNTVAPSTPHSPEAPTKQTVPSDSNGNDNQK